MRFICYNLVQSIDFTSNLAISSRDIMFSVKANAQHNIANASKVFIIIKNNWKKGKIA